MHPHLLGIALGLLASAWIPNWVPIPSLTPAFAGLLLLAALGTGWHLTKRAEPLNRKAQFGLDVCLFLFAVGAAGLVGLNLVQSQLAHRLPSAMHGLLVSAEVEVDSLPSVSGPAMRFDARVRLMGANWDSRQPPPQRIRVTWFEPPVDVRAGDRWSMRLKLRSPVGNLNTTGFDYEAWLLANEVDALGSVRSGVLLHRDEGFSVQNRRAQLRGFFVRLKTPHRGSLLALATGDTSHMTRRNWRLFRDTGTVHLMVISGLHLGLVALYSGLLGVAFFRCFPPVCRLIPAQDAGVICGVAAAGGFSMLCGWTLPIQRAFIMVCCAAIAIIMRRRFRLADAWLLALALVLVQNPYASLSSGFWLSFGAVALLMLLGWNAPVGSGPRYWVRRMFRTQLLLSLGMAPLLLMVIRELPLVSPLANLIAVPVTTLIIVPSVLLASLLSNSMPIMASNLLEAVGLVFSAQAWLLDWLSNLPPLRVATINTSVAVACLVSFLCVFYPARLWSRLLLLVPGVLLVLVLMPSSERVPSGEFRITLLDVGQGLSVLVETRNKSLLYDAGAKYPDGFDLGEAVVVPAIASAGWNHVDEFVLSHWDNDHAGGAVSVLEQLDVRSLVLAADGTDVSPLGDSLLRSHLIRPCGAGDTWTWDQVRFALLHPEPFDDGWRASNDLSCVLRIDNGRHAVLLPGDISQSVEFKIMNRVQPVHLLLAPHHGSRSSSSMSFLRRLRPELVLVSAGFQNSFGHPHADRVVAWHSIGAHVMSTATHGALSWDSTEPHRIQGAREQRHAHWRLALEGNNP